jgi:transcriptional regulator with XRE-family HTH domain
MQLDRWRKLNLLSFREAAELFGCSAGYLSNVEKGGLWPSPQVLIRIATLTEAVGPNQVTAYDILTEWINAHENVVERITRKALAIAAKHKESTNGKAKEKSVQKSTANRKAVNRRHTPAARSKGKGRRNRRSRA